MNAPWKCSCGQECDIPDCEAKGCGSAKILELTEQIGKLESQLRYNVARLNTSLAFIQSMELCPYCPHCGRWPEEILDPPLRVGQERDVVCLSCNGKFHVIAEESVSYHVDRKI